MSFDPAGKYRGTRLRGQIRQQRIVADAAKREMVAEAKRNDTSVRRPGLARVLTRLLRKNSSP